NDIGRNSFNLPLVVSASDFVSLDERQLMRPRQSNGDLPVITFAALAPGSALIDAGADSGQAYNGNAPDLGAFESR
ncbi:pectate lyase, partial [Xanthomonas hortorum pv. gardneri]